MRRRFAIVAVGAALLSVLPLSFGGNSAQAMTCASDPPIDTACAVVFGVVLGTVCTGQPQLPRLPIATTSATVGWPIDCPPLG